MVFYREYFDADGDGNVSQTEFGADPYGILPALGRPAFEDVDIRRDYRGKKRYAVCLCPEK